MQICYVVRICVPSVQHISFVTGFARVFQSDEARATHNVMHFRFVHDDIDSDGDVLANFLDKVTC